MPDTLAAPLAVTTGPDGRASLNYLAAGDRLVAVRVTAESIGTQDFQLVEQPRCRNGQGATITIRLKPTSRLTGRVRNRAGQPVANQAVEVWSQGGLRRSQPNPVEFKNGPLRTAADGSFQTPDNLLVGSSYRVVVRAPGMEPILSDWITIGDKPRVLLPMIQRPLRTISGRVVDRQGKPVAGVEVFQSGDGPERTSTRTDADGRFTLGGFRQGPVFLFARGEGFRFFGRMIKPGEGEISGRADTHQRAAGAARCGCLPTRFPWRSREPWRGGCWSRTGKRFENEERLGQESRPAVAGDGRSRRCAAKLEDVEFPNRGSKSVIQSRWLERWLGPIRRKRRLWPNRSRSQPSAPGPCWRWPMLCRNENAIESWPCSIAPLSKPRPRRPLPIPLVPDGRSGGAVVRAR